MIIGFCDNFVTTSVQVKNFKDGHTEAHRQTEFRGFGGVRPVILQFFSTLYCATRPSLLYTSGFACANFHPLTAGLSSSSQVL